MKMIRCKDGGMVSVADCAECGECEDYTDGYYAPRQHILQVKTTDRAICQHARKAYMMSELTCVDCGKVFKARYYGED